MTRAINDNLPGIFDRTVPLLTPADFIGAASRTSATETLQPATTATTETTPTDGQLTFEIAGIRVSIQTNAVGEALTTDQQQQLLQALSERDLFLQGNLLDVINAAGTDDTTTGGALGTPGSFLTERLSTLQEQIDLARDGRTGADVTQLERAAELLRLELRQVQDFTAIQNVVAQSSAGGMIVQPPRVDPANFEFRGIVVDAVA